MEGNPTVTAQKIREIESRTQRAGLERRHAMTKTELIIQLAKIALGVVFGGYFLWWSVEVLHRLPPH